MHAYFSKSPIRSFLGKKPAIRSENQLTNSQPWTAPTIVLHRCDSPNLSPPALSDSQEVDYTAEQTERGEVG